MGNYPLRESLKNRKQSKDEEKTSQPKPVKQSIFNKLIKQELRVKLHDHIISHFESRGNFNNSLMLEDYEQDTLNSTSVDHNVPHSSQKLGQDLNPIRNRFHLQLAKNRQFIKRDNLGLQLQSIAIFDWDDTFMCTSYISPTYLNYRECFRMLLDEKDNLIISELENHIKSILEFALTQGHVYIVTNATNGWVEYSAKLLFPSLANLLKDVVIISARSWFENAFPADPKTWKIKAFEKIASKYPRTSHINLVAVGDSLNEMEASYQFTRSFKNAKIKTVKLKESPTASQLVKQLNLILNDLPFIYGCQSSVVISLKRDKIRSSTIKNEKRITKDFRLTLQ